MDIRSTVALSLAAAALEESKLEVEAYRTIVALLVHRMGGEVVITLKEVDAFIDSGMSARTLREGDVVTYRTLQKGEECPCQVCQERRASKPATTKVENESETKH